MKQSFALWPSEPLTATPHIPALVHKIGSSVLEVFKRNRFCFLSTSLSLGLPIKRRMTYHICGIVEKGDLYIAQGLLGAVYKASNCSICFAVAMLFPNFSTFLCVLLNITQVNSPNCPIGQDGCT